VTFPNRCTATVRAAAAKDYKCLSTDDLLKEIAASVNEIMASQIKISGEIRRRLLPALAALKAKLRRKKPGFYETLAKIGLNPSTVRSWFYRGRHTEEVLEMLESQPNASARKRHKESGRNELLLHADRMAAAVLEGKADFARRLASEYASARRLAISRPVRND
jgi:hypothetical protein